MSKGLQIIKENNNLAEWSRQVEECRSSGLSVRSTASRRFGKRYKRVLSLSKFRYPSMRAIITTLQRR